MGKELGRYPSSSKPGQWHVITEPNGGGEPYCDCWQWRRTRDCKHLKQFRGEIEHQDHLAPAGVSTGLPLVSTDSQAFQGILGIQDVE